MSNKIINGVVFRFRDKILLISFFTEKLYLIEGSRYMTCNKGKPIPETSIILVNYEEVSKTQFITTPIVEYIFKMEEDGVDKPIKVGFVRTDTIITYAFKAAQHYIESKKEKVDPT